MSAKGSVSKNNGTQIVTLPDEARFPDGVTEVVVSRVGHDLVLSPVGHAWDSFFLEGEGVTGDFMTERASQQQREREPFDSLTVSVIGYGRFHLCSDDRS